MREFKLFQPISLDGEDTLNKAIEIFKEKQIDNIIAVSGRKPIGMLDIQDLIKLNVIE